MCLRLFLVGILAVSTLTGCDIYTSSDRKKFEEDHLQATSLSVSSEMNRSLTFLSCSTSGLAAQSKMTRDLMTFTHDNQVYILRQHLIQDEWVYETDNMNGVYCLYENSTD